MGTMKNFMNWVKGVDIEDEYKELPQETAVEENTVAPRTASEPASARRAGNKVVNLNSGAQLSVVLVKPESFDNAAEIADHLKEKRTVVLNLEQTNKDVARRLLDFLTGVAYAQEGKVKKIANSTYIITPCDVDVLGDLIDELETTGVAF